MAAGGQGALNTTPCSKDSSDAKTLELITPDLEGVQTADPGAPQFPNPHGPVWTHHESLGVFKHLISVIHLETKQEEEKRGETADV